MKKPFKYFFIFLILVMIIFGVSFLRVPKFESILSSLSAVFSRVFEEKITPEDLHQKYGQKNLKILIVPGHDDTSVGAQFRNIKETDLNVELSYHLLEFFKQDKNFKVFVNRERNGNYSQWFSNYLTQNKSAIKTFRDYSQSLGSFAKKEGWMKREVGIIHNPAADNISINLYAVNKWANDNDIDVVLHVHFNDYPTRPRGVPGKYTGFSIYVPEKQLPNSRASIALVEFIEKRLEKYFAKSNFPGESDTVVEEQELIAIGSNASRKGASLLMEYGYLYESQFVNSGPRSVIMKELAAQTYWGIKEYFEGYRISFGYPISRETTLLPHEWKLGLKKGMRGLKDIIHLQMALLQEGLYPPSGKTLTNCPISGIFGPCTEKAVKLFQNKYEISPVGIVGPKTLEKLNELYN